MGSSEADINEQLGLQEAKADVQATRTVRSTGDEAAEPLEL